MNTPLDDMSWRNSASHMWMDRVFAMLFDINFMVDFILFCITGSNFRNALKRLFISSLHTLFPAACLEEMLKEQKDSLNSTTAADVQNQNQSMARNTVVIRRKRSKSEGSQSLNAVRAPIILNTLSKEHNQEKMYLDYSKASNLITQHYFCKLSKLKTQGDVLS